MEASGVDIEVVSDSRSLETGFYSREDQIILYKYLFAKLYDYS